jgi:putative inorganic carbon (hco3(-)) transporter
VTARAELLPNRILAAALLTTALLVGVLAGYSPPLAVGLTLALVFVTLTLSNLTVGVCIFAVLSFIDTVVPVQGALSAPKLLGLMLMLSWLALVTVGEREHRERLFSHPGFLFVLLLFVGWSLISATWAEHPGAAVLGFTRYLPNAMLFLIVFAAVRTRDQLLWVVGAFVIGAFLSGLYGIVVPPPPQDIGRLAGAGGDPNETAAAMVAGLALATALAVAMRGKPLVRTACVAAGVICMLALFLTSSRGGLVSLAVALLAAVALGGRRRGTMLVAAVCAVLVTVFYFATIAPDSVRERVTHPEGGTGRVDIWTVGWRMVQDNAIQGVGSGNFSTSSIHYLLQPGALLRDDFIVDTPKVAHNTYLQVLAELGIVGFVLFITILLFSFVCAFKAHRVAAAAGDRELDIIARATVVALVALFSAYVFVSRDYGKQLWLLLALCPVMLEIARRELQVRLN